MQLSPHHDRAHYRRVLDTAAGIALGIALCLAVQMTHSLLTTPTAQAVPAATWVAGPWQGCTLMAMSQDDNTDIPGTTTHQVNGTWACTHLVPPQLFTPVAHPSKTAVR